MNRVPLISGNWKMNFNHFEAIQTVQKLHYLLPTEVFEDVEVSVHPPFTDLRSVQTLIDSDDLALRLGAQNCHWEASGAFTGEVSVEMLAEVGCTHCIVGHSERRTIFGEVDQAVHHKTLALLRGGVTPIVCVGETDDEREAGRVEEVVGGQLRGSLAGIDASSAEDAGVRLCGRNVSQPSLLGARSRPG